MKCETMREAVEVALNIIGDKTSGEELQREASKHYQGGTVSLTACYTTRLEWRNQRGVTADCRTYDTQHRRNMMPDDRFTGTGWKLLTKVIEANGLATVERLLIEFHSIDQLRNMVADLGRLKKAA